MSEQDEPVRGIDATIAQLRALVEQVETRAGVPMMQLSAFTLYQTFENPPYTFHLPTAGFVQVSGDDPNVLRRLWEIRREAIEADQALIVTAGVGRDYPYRQDLSECYRMADIVLIESPRFVRVMKMRWDPAYCRVHHSLKAVFYPQQLGDSA